MTTPKNRIDPSAPETRDAVPAIGAVPPICGGGALQDRGRTPSGHARRRSLKAAVADAVGTLIAATLSCTKQRPFCTTIPVHRAIAIALVAFGVLRNANMVSAQSNAARLENSTYLSTQGTSQLAPQQFSLEAWIRPDGPGYGNTNDEHGATLLAKPRQGSSGSWLASWTLQWSDSSQHLIFRVGHVYNSTGTLVNSVRLVPRGTIVHVAATFDGAFARLYINGLLDNIVAATSPSVFYFPSDPVLIGAGNYGGGYLRRWQGLADDVRIWSSVLSDAEIALHAICGCDVTVSPNLLAYWKFDGASPSDVSGNDRHATFQSGPAAFANGIAGGSLALHGQPASQSVCRSESAVFSVVPADCPPVGYRWRFAGVPLDLIAHPSASTAMLALSNIQPADAGPYDCVVTYACGSVISNVAELNVYCDCPPFFARAGNVDSFAAPSDATSPGASLAAALNNENARPLLEFDEIPGIAGVTNNRDVAHTFSSLPTDLSSATLTFRVRSGPNTTGETTDKVRVGFAVGTGGSAHFDGVNPTRPFWARFFGDNNATDALVPGVTWGNSIDRIVSLDLAALPLPSQQGGGQVNLLTEAAARGSLDFVVSDDSGVDYVELNGLRRGGATVVWVRTEPQGVAACGASPAMLTATAGGTGPLTYQWRRDGVAINTTQNPSAATSSLSTFFAGAYDCVISNSCSTATSVVAVVTRCLADTDDGSGTGVCDGGVTIDDLLYYLRIFEEGSIAADTDDGSGGGTPDGGVTIDDLLYYLQRFEAGC